MLKRQNPLFQAYEREKKYTVNVQCSVQYTLLLLYLCMLYEYHVVAFGIIRGFT
jgi:hypothetical protein